MRTLFLFIAAGPCVWMPVLADENELPDSIITIEHAYQYCVSDPEKAQAIMDELMVRRQDKDWELDWCQADLYYNTGKYRLALFFFEKTAAYKAVNTVPSLYMGLLSTMMECYRMNNDLEKAMQTALSLMDIAKALDDDAETGRAYMFMGIITLQQKNAPLAKHYFVQADTHLKASENSEYLYHFYLTIANLIDEKGDYIVAADYLEKAREGLEAMAKNDAGLLLPEGQIAYEYGRLHALASDIFAKSGRKQEAAGAYEAFLASPYSADDRTRIHIVPYLLKSEKYDEALAISLRRVDQLRADTDTIGEDMAAALRYLIEAYQKTGQFSDALYYAQLGLSLHKAIRQKDRENTALELATLYQVQEKEELLLMREATIKRRSFLLLLSSLIALLAIAAVALVVRSIKRTEEKNRVMVSRIKELQSCKQKLDALEKQMPALAAFYPSDVSSGADASKNGFAELFALADQKIKEQKLYLKSDLTRDELALSLGIKKSDFSRAVNECAGFSFTDYINNLRLEEALRLLEKSDNLCIEAIAEDSGFGSARSFYRQFKSKYSMSPAEYRKWVK